MRLSLFILLIFSLTIIINACSSIIPATTPPQLSEPILGAAIIITDETVDAGIFQVDYPDGWRIVKTSVAGDPIELVFASPNDEMWIRISEIPIVRPENALAPNTYEHYENVEIEDFVVYTYGQAPIEQREEFDEIYETVLASINIP